MSGRRQLAIGLILLACGLAGSLAWRNFRECRAAGFSRTYCATTHLVK